VRYVAIFFVLASVVLILDEEARCAEVGLFLAAGDILDAINLDIDQWLVR